jgi:ribosomal protein S27AE
MVVHPAPENGVTSSKECFKCKTVKPLTEFYKHPQMGDGHLNKCKQCSKNDVNKHRLENIEHIREYDRNRGKNIERIKLSAEVTRAWRAEDSRRHAAHNKVARAIKSGELVRQPCVRCGETKSLAHHEDYDKPLDVMWLCQPCHKQRHKELKE